MRDEKLHEGIKAMPQINDELLTRGDICKLFKVSLQTVIRLEQAGRLPAVRLGAGTVRYRREDVLAFIEASR